MNALSATGFIVNSGWNGAYPSAFINVIWLAISLYGLLGRPGTRTAAHGGVGRWSVLNGGPGSADEYVPTPSHSLISWADGAQCDYL